MTINAEELTDLPDLVGVEKPDAILLNSDDWGYAHFVLDKESIEVFEQSLAKVESQIDRATIIGQLMFMMRQLEYPATLFPRVMNQLLDEKNQNLINAVWGALVKAQTNYLPQETISKFNKDVTDFFFRKAKKETEDKALQMFCIDKAMPFVTEEEHLRLTSGWLKEGVIEIDGTKLGCELTNEHKYAILKKFYASPVFSLDEKKALKNKTFESDDSDAGRKVAKICEYSLPEAALKEKLWNEMTDLNSGDSLSEATLKMAGFFQRRSQLELITPYFEKFYAVVNKIVENRDREFAQNFCSYLSPSFMARESDEKAFTELLEKANKDFDFFVRFIK